METDSEVVYSEDNDKDDDWEEKSFEDYQELINDFEGYCTHEQDNEECWRAKALPSKVQIFSYNKMENKMSVDDSTQVGCEDINMSSRREKKSLTNGLYDALQKVCEDEVKSDFEDDYYDSEVVYSEKVDEDEDYWKEYSFEDFQELINYEQDNEEWRRAKALPAKVQIFSNNKMEKKMSVDDSTQVGCEDTMSSRRERKSLTDSLSRVLEKVYEDEDIESMADFEDDHYNSNRVYNEDEYEDYWKEHTSEIGRAHV